MALSHKCKEPGEPGGKFPGGGQGARKVSTENRTFAVVPSRLPCEGTAVLSQGSPSAPPHRRNKPRFPIGGYHFLLPEETLLSPFPRSLHLPCPRPGGRVGWETAFPLPLQSKALSLGTSFLQGYWSFPPLLYQLKATGQHLFSRKSGRQDAGGR